MNAHFKKAKLAALALLTLASIDAAQASIFQIENSGTTYNYTFGAPVPSVFNASITVTTADDPLTTFDRVVGVSGTINGESITGLAAPGQWDPATINQFSSSAPYVDNGGLSFTSTTQGWNFRNYGGADNTIAIGNRDAHWYVYTGAGNGSVSVSELAPPAANVPEPGSYPLVLAALGMAGLAARRRQR